MVPTETFKAAYTIELQPPWQNTIQSRLHPRPLLAYMSQLLLFYPQSRVLEVILLVSYRVPLAYSPSARQAPHEPRRSSKNLVMPDLLFGTFQRVGVIELSPRTSMLPFGSFTAANLCQRCCPTPSSEYMY